jgi:hypothetical protein
MPDLPIVAVWPDTNIQDDACTELPWDAPDLTGRIVVVRRGGCQFSVKARNVAARGASAILIYKYGPLFRDSTRNNGTCSHLATSLVLSLSLDCEYPRHSLRLRTALGWVSVLLSLLFGDISFSAREHVLRRIRYLASISSPGARRCQILQP